jgi:uncharacterized membrane protein
MNRGARNAQKGTTMRTTDSTTTTTTAATVATQGAQVAPKKAASTKGTKAKKDAPKAKTGKTTPSKKMAAKTTPNPNAEKVSVKGRANSKKTAVLDLLRRKDGATLAEIAKATGWQNHSIRGFISGTVGKRMGLKVESSKSDAGERMYKIAGK